jgi:sulfate adenylyltransferase
MLASVVFSIAIYSSLNTGAFLAFTPSQEERSKNLQRLGFVAAELARAGAAVIAAPIAPHHASRDVIKETIIHTAGAGGNVFVVHVATPLEYCEANDRKGIYARARIGELKGVAGVDIVYEAPEHADLTVNVTTQSIPEIVHSQSDGRLLVVIS